MHLFCAVLEQKIELLILRQQFGGFSPEVATIINIRWLKNEQANVCLFTFESPCPYFSLNLRHIVMSHIHCEMHNKRSKTMGVTLESMG